MVMMKGGYTERNIVVNVSTDHIYVNCVLQIILEGMGRAIHTNFNARFKCDALKVIQATDKCLPFSIVALISVC